MVLFPMKRQFLPWIFSLILLVLIVAHSELSNEIAAIAVAIALLADMFAVRISILQVRIKLVQKGLELCQIIPSTVVIFGWLLYAVVHFQIFLSIVHFLDLPPAVLKWVFPLTALKALWPVYYLGSKLPGKKEDNFSINKIVFQIPWAMGGAFIWWFSNETAGNSGLKIVWGIVIMLIALSPGILVWRLMRIYTANS